MSAKSNFRDGIHHFSTYSMGTIFDLFILHDDERYAEQVSTALFSELSRIEEELSKYKPNSDISRINNMMPGERITLGLDSFHCIKESIRLHNFTKGAFNIACGALYNCWLNNDKSLRHASEEEISKALNYSNLNNILIHDDYTIEVKTEGMMLDLGGYGKGYAVDKCVETLKDWNIKDALISSGRSSVRAINSVKDYWEISISNPNKPDQVLKILQLKNISVGSSGLQKGAHIIDTIEGKPISGNRASWVFSDSAALSDALSTAVLILGKEFAEEIIFNFERAGVIIVENKPELEVEDIFTAGIIPDASS
jgi:thiamine biosynthesis lipoprotein